MTTPVDDQYTPTTEIVRPPPDTNLPFTGFDAIAFTVVAIAFIAVGFLMRRAQRDA